MIWTLYSPEAWTGFLELPVWTISPCIHNRFKIIIYRGWERDDLCIADAADPAAVFGRNRAEFTRQSLGESEQSGPKLSGS